MTYIAEQWMLSIEWMTYIQTTNFIALIYSKVSNEIVYWRNSMFNVHASIDTNNYVIIFRTEVKLLVYCVFLYTTRVFSFHSLEIWVNICVHFVWNAREGKWIERRSYKAHFAMKGENCDVNIHRNRNKIYNVIMNITNKILNIVKLEHAFAYNFVLVAVC